MRENQLSEPHTKPLSRNPGSAPAIIVTIPTTTTFVIIKNIFLPIILNQINEN